MWSTRFPSSPNIDSSFAPGLAHGDFLRRYARRLLRQVRSSQSSAALPVLRRMVAMRITPEISVAELFPLRASLQLKHVLHMLARELDYPAWEVCAREIDARDSALLDRYRLELGMFRDFQTNWFADMASARNWQRGHGGYLVAYGKQAVAILAD
ncbi:hypothetical protein PQR62_22355 [Herbaspirillum lusitanum]|uniref:Uncharacterized protein n=1 Tax=Herbaspirillum lusitanum TaxID=213312 RepID=A0ABW9AEY8_9BURK